MASTPGHSFCAAQAGWVSWPGSDRAGLIFPTAGLYGNVIRMLVPLVVSDEDIAEALEILDEAFAAVVGG